MKTFFSHFSENTKCDLAEHLNSVGKNAGGFAAVFGAKEWATLAGRLHDLGKYGDEFQQYLRGEINAPRGKIKHSSAGGLYAQNFLAKNAEEKCAAKLLSFVIFGHHTGLPNCGDGDAKGASLEERIFREGEWLDKARKNEKHFPEFVRNATIPGLACLRRNTGHENAPSWIRLSLWTRMLFSCLVDADRLHAEKSSSPVPPVRGDYAEISALREKFDGYMKGFKTDAEKTAIDKIRADILTQCVAAGEQSPGLFSFTVPTGGGKTLSSMAFALAHAAAHGKRRIIYAIPFTSIIEQTADIFRGVFGDDNVVEHHSNIRGEESEDEQARRAAYKNRLATENWDAPIVITTNVQFFESLFAAAPGKCRKLHNIADSVVILDEAQTLPLELIAPTLAAIEELTAFYKTSFVFCTATQPAFRAESLRKAKAALNSAPREVCEQPETLFRRDQFRRVRARWDLSKTEWDEIAVKLCENKSALCIVNSRNECRDLYEKTKARMSAIGRGAAECFHLSALMCGEHRARQIAKIKARLKNNEPVIVVSTTLIEAGVDIDFPVVWRALAGLDSIAQAAGRCNREGKLPDGGELRVFMPPKIPPPGFIRQGWQVVQEMRQLFAADDDMFTPDKFRRYFELLYRDIRNFDDKGISRLLSSDEMQFRDAAAKFRFIEEDGKIPVIVWYTGSEKMRKTLQMAEGARLRATMRGLQRFSVSVPEKDFDEMRGRGEIEELTAGVFVLTESGAANYSDETGFAIPGRGGV